MFETPMTLDRNNYCNFCSECIKSCSQDNIVIRFRSFAKDLWVFAAKGIMDEAWLAMTLVGITIILTGEMVEPWHRWMDDWRIDSIQCYGHYITCEHRESNVIDRAYSRFIDYPVFVSCRDSVDSKESYNA